MNKTEFIAIMAEKTGLPKAKCDEVCQAFMDTVIDGAQKYGSVRVGKRATFKLNVRKAREGRNPQTGAKIQIPETRAVVLRYTL